jgi:hypothetical protein
MRHRILGMPRSVLIAATLIVGLAVAAAAALGSASGGGTINGCYANNNGALRVIDTAAGGACKTSETALSWQQQGTPGPVGPTGATGATGSTGATGATGPAGVSAISALPAGDSESGEVGGEVNHDGTTAGDFVTDTVTFPVPLPATLSDAKVIFTPTGTPVTHCSGPGHADAGYLCIYVTSTGDVGGTPLTRYYEAGGQTPGAGFYGFEAFWPVTTSGLEAWAEGSWTVTA